jgi:E3 ubiquitin-protein ligase HECTD1
VTPSTANSSIPTINATIDTTRSLPSTATAVTTDNGIIPSDRSQQQIIEFIRSRDVQGFINHIEQSNIDVNYTDNVGQTMLNWVAAFGTREMIEYLCRRGADVNRGQRSSSLHYAACFGRPSIVRLLIKYGGNVDLRDEDGLMYDDKIQPYQSIIIQQQKILNNQPMKSKVIWKCNQFIYNVYYPSFVNYIKIQ